MNFDKPKKLSDSLQDYLERFPQKKKLKQGMILAAWQEVVGERIASQTKEVHFEGK